MTFSVFSCFLHPTRCCLVPSTKSSSCLPRRAVGAKRLADLSHNRWFMARSRRTPAMLVGRCSSELSGHRLQGKSKKSQPLSEAPHRFIVWYSAWWGSESCPARSRRNPEGAYLVNAVRSFDYPSPRTEFFLRYALDGHGYIFSCTVIIFHPQVCAKSLNRGGSARCGLRWLKGCQRHE